MASSPVVALPSLDAVGGMVDAAAAMWLLAVRRFTVGARRSFLLVAICALVTVAAVTLRSSSIVSFFRFLGVKPENSQTTGHVQTYAQRVLLSYIGVEIWFNPSCSKCRIANSGAPWSACRASSMSRKAMFCFPPTCIGWEKPICRN